ncbi:hypothetical protein ACQRUO_39040, partial [Kitasatospora sp. LaBMicrA B282]
MQSPSRRTFLATGALAAAGLLTACTAAADDKGARGAGASGPAAKPADPDLPLRTRALAAVDGLLAQYDAVLGPSPAPGLPLAGNRTAVQAQRAALAAGLPTAAASPSRSGSATATPRAAASGAASAGAITP